MTFHVRAPFCLIELQDVALSGMLAFRQFSKSGMEAGGVLIGTRRGPHFEVFGATSPQPSDKRSRFSFVRSGKKHRELATKEWARSGQRHGYIGEWHTHPELQPTPSWIDRRGWRKLHEQLQQPLIHLIVGFETVGLWYCDARGRVQEAAMIREVTSFV